MALAKVNGVFRLAQDVESRYLNDGTMLAKLNLVNSEKFKKQSGEQVENSCFIDATLFKRQAEIAQQYLKKGSKIYIDATLSQDKWQDQQGNNRSKHTLKINSFEMLDSKQDNQQSNSYQQPQQSQGYNQNPPVEYQRSDNPPQQQNIPQIDIEEDEIPFSQGQS